MALGTPVLATSVGGLPEVIDDGRTGFLAPPGDPAVWAARILELLQDRQRLVEVGGQARDAMVEQVGGERYKVQMTALYAQVRAQRSHLPDRYAVTNGAESCSMEPAAAEPASSTAAVAERTSQASQA
jgi:hypothetical protein